MELGVYTFAELRPDPETGRAASPGQRLLEVLEEAEVAEQAGLDVFGVGEHHRPDFAVSTPAVVLAAVAARTSRIRLTSAASWSSRQPKARRCAPASRMCPQALPVPCRSRSTS